MRRLLPSICRRSVRVCGRPKRMRTFQPRGIASRVKTSAVHARRTKGGNFNVALESVSVRAPGKHDVVVQVKAASINPLDVWMRHGYGHSVFASSDGCVRSLGRDASGVITETGSEVWDFKPGDEVILASTPLHSSSDGTLRPTAVVHASAIAHKPACLSHAQACTIPWRGLTAHSAVFSYGRAHRGTHALVVGGGGGVGGFAIQLLAAHGCKVSASCGTSDADKCFELGATNVYDYVGKAWIGPSSAAPSGFDLVLDAAGGKGKDTSRVARTASLRQQWLPHVRRGGNYVTLSGGWLTGGDTYGTIPGLAAAAAELAGAKYDVFTAHGVHFHWGLFQGSGAQLQQLADLAERGQLTIPESTVYPWAEVLYALDGHSLPTVPVVEMDSTN